MDIIKFDTADVRLAARMRGSGRPILLLHGFPDTFETWTKGAIPDDQVAVEDRLLGAGFRTISLAMRGSPPSGISKSDDYTVKAISEDIISTLDYFDIERALIVGHDWGASGAYAAAARFPGRIERMVTLAIPPFPVLPSGIRERLARPHNLYLSHGWLSAWLLRRKNADLVARLYRNWSPNGSFPSEHIAHVRAVLADRQSANAAVQYYSAPFSNEDRSQIVRPINTPTLAIYGAGEPSARHKAFANALPLLGDGSRVEKIPKVGHWPHLEAPNRVGRLIVKWFRQ